jgi:hypothetical protein
MVSEHKSRGFPDAQLESTFTTMTVGNSIAAVFAGFVAEVLCAVSVSCVQLTFYCSLLLR